MVGPGIIEVWMAEGMVHMVNILEGGGINGMADFDVLILMSSPSVVNG